MRQRRSDPNPGHLGSSNACLPLPNGPGDRAGRAGLGGPGRAGRAGGTEPNRVRSSRAGAGRAGQQSRGDPEFVTWAGPLGVAGQGSLISRNFRPEFSRWGRGARGDGQPARIRSSPYTSPQVIGRPYLRGGYPKSGTDDSVSRRGAPSPRTAADSGGPSADWRARALQVIGAGPVDPCSKRGLDSERERERALPPPPPSPTFPSHPSLPQPPTPSSHLLFCQPPQSPSLSRRCCRRALLSPFTIVLSPSWCASALGQRRRRRRRRFTANRPGGARGPTGASLARQLRRGPGVGGVR